MERSNSSSGERDWDFSGMVRLISNKAPSAFAPREGTVLREGIMSRNEVGLLSRKEVTLFPLLLNNEIPPIKRNTPTTKIRYKGKRRGEDEVAASMEKRECC